jgi:hypothetical protein
MNLSNSVFPLDKEKDYFSPPIPRGRSASSAPSCGRAPSRARLTGLGP